MGNGTGTGQAPRIASLLIKPVSAVCNLECAYCFYLDRGADPCQALPARRMTLETLERLVDTYLFYSYPNSVFAFQGGEPMLAGLAFFEKLVELQKQYGRAGQSVSNALQTNATLVDESWCALFREYRWLVGVSLDGPEPVNDLYRRDKAGRGTWKRVIEGIQTLQINKVEFNCLCVLSRANVDKPREIYRFFRSLGVGNLQFIPLAEFAPDGTPLPFSITPGEYGRFLVEIFELWWLERRQVRIRFFDNLAEALAGVQPSTCTMHETCASYVVVESNGDIYPCDFFVERDWKLGNLHLDSWTEIARRQRRYSFAAAKAVAHAECRACRYQWICRGGCPKFRHGPKRDFAGLDYFCAAYRMIFDRAVGPLGKEVEKLLGRAAPRGAAPSLTAPALTPY